MSKKKELRSITTKELKEIGKKDYSEMTVKELKAEKAKIELTLEGKRENSSILPTMELFYRALCSQFLLHLNQELPSTLHVYSRGTRNKYVFSLLESVPRFLDRWLFRAMNNRRPTLTQRGRLYVIYSDLMITNISYLNNVPVTLRTVLAMHESFPGYFDKAFPGYIEGGAINLVLESNKMCLDDEDLI